VHGVSPCEAVFTVTPLTRDQGHTLDAAQVKA
jgi:hypothetical protein